MNKFFRAVIAISICLSGWALLPFATLPTQAFGWELFAEAYGEIFSDGFDVGGTSNWDRVVGEVGTLQPESTDDLVMTLRIDGANWDSKDSGVVALVTGVSDKGIPTFKIEARRLGRQFEVRARATSEPNVWAESQWRLVDERYGLLEIEWRRAMEETEDGFLYVSVDGDLLLWLVDLDNAYLPLREIQRTYLGGKPVASTLSGSYQGRQMTEK